MVVIALGSMVDLTTEVVTAETPKEESIKVMGLTEVVIITIHLIVELLTMIEEETTSKEIMTTEEEERVEDPHTKRMKRENSCKPTSLINVCSR